MVQMQKIKKVIISLFIILCISTVLYSNRPSFIGTMIDKTLDNHFSKIAAYNIRYVIWAIKNKIQMFGYMAGLGNHWIMFGFQQHFNWYYKIKAKYLDGSVILLPLPMQSKRTFWQWLLFDIKEAKFQHNIYQREDMRKAYAMHLCKNYPEYKGYPIRSIEWFMYWQYINDPKLARQLGTHLDKKMHKKLLHSFSCSEADWK